MPNIEVFLSPAEVEYPVSLTTAAKSFQPEPEKQAAVYVHFMSGEVATITPATDVVVQPDMVLVYNGPLPVASYPRKDVFSCSKTQTSPTLS
jgi:hypothetical protein